MAKAQDNRFKNWLEKSVGRKQSLVCQTCAYGEEVRELIRQFMIARAEGKTRRPNRDLHDYLTDPENGINYHLGDSALNTHMRRCERELHKRMRAADVRNGLARGPHNVPSTQPAPKKKSTKTRSARSKDSKDE